MVTSIEDDESTPIRGGAAASFLGCVRDQGRDGEVAWCPDAVLSRGLTEYPGEHERRRQREAVAPVAGQRDPWRPPAQHAGRGAVPGCSATRARGRLWRRWCAPCVVALHVGLAFGCGEPADKLAAHHPIPKPEGACPAPAVIGALHAAAFFAERGDSRTARFHLKKANTKVLAGSPEGREIYERLSRVLRSEAGGDPPLAELEAIRYDVTYWSCLSADLHDELHLKLPSLGSAAASAEQRQAEQGE